MPVFHLYFETTTKHRMSYLEISVPKKEKSQTKQINFCVYFKRSQHSKETTALILLSLKAIENHSVKNRREETENMELAIKEKKIHTKPQPQYKF